MTFEIAYVLLALVGMAILLAFDAIRADVAGFIMLSSLLLGGVLSVPEALAGFSDPAVHMIAGLFVVGGGIFQTGLAEQLGSALGRAASGDARKLLLLVMLGTALLSAFLSSTGTVAVMIPVVASLARRSRVSPSLLMIPLAFATLLGGLLTLIATPPNVIVSTELQRAGHTAFGFFDFTGPGLCLLVLGVGFTLLCAPKLLPIRAGVVTATELPSAHELWARYELGDWLYELEVAPSSPLVGQSIRQHAIRTRFGVGVFAIQSHAAPAASARRAQADDTLAALDRLTVRAAEPAVTRFCEQMQLRILRRPQALPSGLLAAEVLLPPGSAFIGKTVADTRLRSRFDLSVMAIFRSEHAVRASVGSTRLSVGDLLLLIGTGKALRRLRDESKDAILVTETEELRRPEFRTQRAPHALLILLAMLVVMAAELVPAVTAVIAAALAMVLCGCLDAQTADKSLNWESILLLATVLPLATALVKTGAVALMVQFMAHVLGSAGPYVVMTGLFALTAAVGLFISNTATAALVAPIGVELATSLHLAPQPLLMTIAIAASSAFLTPVSSPVNMMVMNAGEYRFGDFARLGAPLLVLMWLGTLLVVPWFFPFQPR